MPEPPTITRKLVHQAFKGLHDAHALGDHPLGGLGVIEARRAEAGYADTPSGRSLALRAVLRDAVIALRPEGAEDYQDRRWRQFAILSERYLNRRAPDAIADQLGIARSTYDHDHADALDEVASRLQRMQDELDTARPAGPRFFSLAPPLPAQAVIGREAEIGWLREALIGPGSAAALYGLPGVGKTTLAVALAHDPQIEAEFDGGILWSGLGRSPDRASLLTTWGVALGLRLDEMSHLSPDGLAGALRAMIGMRRMLVVLDDAWSAGDAAALALGGPGCRTLITTRLPGVAIDLAGDRALHLAELPPVEARALLAELAPEIVRGDPASAERLVEAAGGLPMTLNLMGRHLRRESRVGGSARRLEQGLERLLMPGTRLQLVEAADGAMSRSLMGMIALSVDVLDPSSAEALLALALLPPKPNTFAEEAALSVAGASAGTLDALCDAGLVAGAAAGRYTIHRAISDYARLRLEAQAENRRAASARMVEYFAQETHRLTADGALLPDDETENCLAALDLAGEVGLVETFVTMINALYPSLEMRGLFARAGRYLAQARELLGETADPAVSALMLGNLGRVAIREGNHGEAERLFGEALARLGEQGADESRIALTTGLGIAVLNQGHFDEAHRLLDAALAKARSGGHDARTGALLANLGTLELAQGNTARADELLAAALESARRLGDRVQAGAALANLGVLAARRRDYLAAETCFEESLALANQVGNRESMSSLLTNLGALASERGDEGAAATLFEQALGHARAMGQQDRLCQLLANQSALAIRRGDLAEARRLLDEGLTIARAIDHHEHLILLLANLGALAEAEGDLAAARGHFQDALARAEALGLTRYVETLRQQIGQLGQSGHIVGKTTLI